MVKKDKHIKPGYQLTEVGIIPVDWEIKRLDELFEITAGGDLEKNKYSPIKTHLHVYPIYSNALTNRGLYGYSTDYNQISGTITVTARGTIGFANARSIPYSAIGRLLILNPLLGNKIDCSLISEIINHKIVFSIESTGVPQLTGPQISKYKIAIPSSKTEQSAIAQVLSDTDTLICSLDELIEKKKSIKQGTMQVLLTGNRRLPGFSGDWKTLILGSIVEIKTGKKDVNEGNTKGKYPFFTCSRDHTYSDSYSFEGKAILIAGNGEVGNLHYYDGKFEAYQRTYVLQNFGIDIRYLWHQLDSNFKKSLGIGTIGSSIPYIKMENITGFSFNAPVDPLEQMAIAQFLSDMDLEISKLEKKRDKYKQIKQGMMSELLTGNIRLLGVK